MTAQTFPTHSCQDLVKAFADDYPVLKLRDDDFTNPQVTEFLCKEDVSC